MKKKILSLLTAFAMVFGIIAAPFTSASAADETTNSVTVHKILQSKDNLGNTKFPGTNGLDNKEYVGEDITKKTIENYGTEKAANSTSTIASYFGEGSKEVKGVFFAWQVKAKGTNDSDEKQYIKKDTTNTDENVVKPAFNEKGEVEFTTNLDEAFGAETGDQGVKFDTSKLKGTYLIQEIHDKSSYVGENGETLTDMKAVPVEITLPLVNDKGVVTEAHVYPKNTEEKPTTNKDFSDQFNDGQNGRDENVDEKSVQDNPETSEKEKKENWEPKSVGDTVNYTVKTTIPAKSNYATAYWNDEMTDGLTLDLSSVKLAYTGNEKVNLEKDTDYTIKATTNDGKQGFELEFTPVGLEKINGQENQGEITITYSAKLNENAVVEVPESNDVNFYYGNNPRKGNTPKPNYPDDNGKLKVTKTWDDGEWAKNEKATFRIVDAQTGKTVTKEDLVGAPENYKFEAEKEIGYAGDKKEVSAEWEYLDKNKQYKVVEVSVTYEDEDGKVQTLTGWEANYAVTGNGETKVTNYRTNNPNPINPTEPKVVTGGARFVKTNANGSERLPGAEFVVKKNVEGQDKFLTGTDADRTEYETAQKAYEDAIKVYNKLDADAQTDEELAKVKNAEKARDRAWNATLKDMTQWGEEKDAIKLTSNDLGQFEIAGLAPGTYTLVEITPPEGYANNKNEFPFEIKEDGTQKTKNIDFGVKDDKAEDNAQQVINKKVTIPETGGIGSLIFIAVGLAIMGSAFVAYRKSQARA